DQLFWHDVFSGNALGWLQDESEEATPFGAMGKDGIVDSVAGDTISQQEIFIWNGDAIFETHERASFVNLLHFSFVRLRINTDDRHTSIQVDLERDIVTGTHSGARVGWI